MQQRSEDFSTHMVRHQIASWTHFWTNPHLKVLTAGFILFCALTVNLFHLFVAVPPTFTSGSTFVVKEGQTLNQIADSLEERGFIRSPFAFTVLAQALFFESKGAMAGTYFFESRINTFQVAERIMTGDFRIKPKKVTVFEGLNRYEIADLLANSFQNFDKEKFIQAAPEGYLFPDTYFFPPDVDTARIIEIMQSNFNDRIDQFKDEVKASGRTLDDIITMASIVETEARQYETRQTIAGILWRRLDEKMPLQVDVSFRYINGKGTADLSLDDLEIDSPYNSYKYAGLPPTPISNPGLSSIRATLNPEKTDYYFFLTDEKGVMHYAKTFAEHKKNKELYLY